MMAHDSGRWHERKEPSSSPIVEGGQYYSFFLRKRVLHAAWQRAHNIGVQYLNMKRGGGGGVLPED